MNPPSKQSLSPAALLGIAGTCAATIFAARTFLRHTSRPAFDLRGKTILITGGSRGFGLALAHDFGARGAKLALCARDTEELDRACAELQAKGIDAHSIASDISEPGQASHVIERAIAELGSIDVLVNDAGQITVGSFDSFTHQDFEDAMNLMFWAPVNLTYAVLPHMTSRGSGHIVNITSIGGRVSIPHLLPYSCAKFAFVGFSTGLTTEVKAKGLNVLTVVPGLMRTGSYLQAAFKGASKEEFAWFGLLGNIPGFSVAADFAAAEVRKALESRGDVCTISFPAKVLIALEALAPEVTRELLTVASRYLLPHSDSKHAQPGKAIYPALNALFQSVTALGRLAATRLNERPGAR